MERRAEEMYSQSSSTRAQWEGVIIGRWQLRRGQSTSYRQVRVSFATSVAPLYALARGHVLIARCLHAPISFATLVCETWFLHSTAILMPANGKEYTVREYIIQL